MTTSVPLKIVPAAYWSQRLLAILLFACILSAVIMVSRTDNVRWSEIGDYLFEPSILEGIKLTVYLTFLAVTLGTAGGIILAAMRSSNNAFLSLFAHVYIWFFRGTPLLVQLIFWFNIQLFVPSIGFGSFSVDTNSVISAFLAALLALSLNESAYMAEIVRGGVLAVDKGQSEAATALGYTPAQTFRKIILPQALRVIIPPIGNQTISMLKTTSLVSFVAAQDLLTRVQNIYAKNFLVIELLFVAAIWYLVLTTIATMGQVWIESYFGQKSATTSSVRVAISRVRKFVTGGSK